MAPVHRLNSNEMSPEDLHTHDALTQILAIVEQVSGKLTGADPFNAGWISAIGAICVHGIDVLEDV